MFYGLKSKAATVTHFKIAMTKVESNLFKHAFTRFPVDKKDHRLDEVVYRPSTVFRLRNLTLISMHAVLNTARTCSIHIAISTGIAR